MIVVCAFLCVTASAQDQRFANPPKEARPYVWWHWINGNTSKDGIRKDLEWMNRIGIAGFHQMEQHWRTLGKAGGRHEETHLAHIRSKR